MGKHIKKFKEINENNNGFDNSIFEDTSELLKYIPILEIVDSSIDYQDVMLYYKENDLDFHNMSEIQMYIEFIKANSLKS